MRLISLLGVIVLAVACQKTADDKQGRLPPPANATIPADLKIDVQVGGQPAPAIDHARLSTRAPDFKDAEHQAWRIAPLLGVDAGKPITVLGERDIKLTLPPPKAPGDPEPVLFLTRRGDLTAALLSPADPFPSYHGQGRQLARAGDPLPRLAGRVLAIHVD